MYRLQETKAHKLARHGAVAGVVVVGGLIAGSALLGPGGPGPRIVKDQPKAEFALPARVIPLERQRDEKPLQQTAAAAASATQSSSLTQPTTVAPGPPARSEPTPTFTALTGLPTPEEAARATRIAQEKIAAEKAKRRLARERARARAAARTLDQQPYDQHTWSGNAFAPRQSYGPFGRSQNGWGNGWSVRDSGWMDRAGR